MVWLISFMRVFWIGIKRVKFRLGGRLSKDFTLCFGTQKREGNCNQRLYMTLAEVLANCLQKCLWMIIFHRQVAFTQGRQILDHVLIAHQCTGSQHARMRIKDGNFGIRLQKRITGETVERPTPPPQRIGARLLRLTVAGGEAWRWSLFRTCVCCALKRWRASIIY